MNNAKVVKRKTLSVEELKENLHYDPLTGIFTRIKSNCKRIKVGDIANGKDNNGYVRIKVNGIIFFAHRLAWLYTYGEMPKDCIDHKNGNPSDNRIDNLRESTHRQNMQNRVKTHVNNQTGFLGVTQHKRKGKKKEKLKYTASIKMNGKTIHLGDFENAELASEAYLVAKRKMHEFCTI